MNKKTFFLLAAILFFAVILRLAFFSGIGGSDDVLYASYAHQLSNNEYSFPSTHHGTRIGLLYPVSFMYALFGVNEFSSNILVFISSIAGIILIYYFGREFFSEKVGLTAAFLLSFFPMDVIFATKLLPDLPSAFFMSLGVFFFLKAEKNVRGNQATNYLLTGIFIGVAYMVRESALLILLFFLVYVIFYRKFKPAYFLVFAGFAAIFLIESLIFLANTGDFLYRLHSLTSYYPTVVEIDEFFGRGSFPFSVLHFPYIMFTGIQFGLFCAFILISLAYCMRMKNKDSYPFIIWFLALLLYLIFGSVSLTEYLPFAAIPRYLMIVVFPSTLMLAVFLNDRSFIMKKMLLPSILAILLLTSIGFIYLDKDSRHSIDNAKKIYPEIERIEKPVYTDYRSKLILEYLSGYGKNNIRQFMHVENGRTKNITDLRLIKEAYVFVDKKAIKNLLEPHPLLAFPEEINDVPKNWIVINEIKNPDGDTILYYAP